jgi:hypothetical protein
MEKIWIRDGKKSDPVSGINIPDPQHWYYGYCRAGSSLLRAEASLGTWKSLTEAKGGI